MKFTFDIVHVLGKQLITFDMLSREDEKEVKVFVDAVIQALPATEARLTTIIKK